jgi:hypothetical protein
MTDLRHGGRERRHVGGAEGGGRPRMTEGSDRAIETTVGGAPI